MEVPPLRERDEDLEIFTQHFIKMANQELGKHIKRLSSGALTTFRQYDWPGNLRELKNVIRRMVLLTEGETAGMESLPDEMTLSVNQMPKVQGTDLKALNEVNEKELIQEILRQVKNNKSKAARLLNIDRKTLYKKMEKYQIEG
jgi:two-component system response regulator HydG